jgi:Holliday junction resolvase-like predicted endonuclease
MNKSEYIGKLGEEIAVRHLVSLGYAIVERNYRGHSFEIDVICRNGDRYAFVEVKSVARENSGVEVARENPINRVDRWKQRHVQQGILWYTGLHTVAHWVFLVMSVEIDEVNHNASVALYECI